MKRIVFAALLLLAMGGVAQDSDAALREGIDARLAPRSLLLAGGDLESPSGRYVIEFPPPNECVVLAPILAKSRAFALYRAVSAGGFTLKPSDAGLTVWTIEEWDSLKKEPWYPDLAAAHEKTCGKQKQSK